MTPNTSSTPPRQTSSSPILAPYAAITSTHLSPATVADAASAPSSAITGTPKRVQAEHDGFKATKAKPSPNASKPSTPNQNTVASDLSSINAGNA
jgi:hypothetical protein